MKRNKAKRRFDLLSLLLLPTEQLESYAYTPGQSIDNLLTCSHILSLLSAWSHAKVPNAKDGEVEEGRHKQNLRIPWGERNLICNSVGVLVHSPTGLQKAQIDGTLRAECGMQRWEY